MSVCAQLLQLCLILCDPMTVAHWASLSMGFSRQEYWSVLPCPPPGDLSDPGIEPLPTQGLNPDLPHCRQSFTI